MVFSSIIFLTVFLPLILILYFLTPKQFKNILLLISSIVFYSWGAPKFIIVILLTTTLDFYLAKRIHNSIKPNERKIALITSLILNLGLLFYFKYSNFFIDNTNVFLRTFGFKELDALNIIMPIGISFYTFESITYLVDVYRKIHAPLKNFWDYQLYILFFPKLIAGPITRYHEIADQIDYRDRNHKMDLIITGMIKFIIGLGKKVLLANTIGQFADSVFDNSTEQSNSTIMWLGTLAYTFQIYFDFSGYSDMAIGLGNMFGFKLPENFNNPYTASSITEFWRRWHITLGNWMKNYLYIPLGGNKVQSKYRLYLNLSIVFLVSGFWHGASWNFILWGAIHGFFMVIERIFLGAILNKLPKIASVVYCFFIINLTWVLLRSENIDETISIYKNLFNFKFSGAYIEPQYVLCFILCITFSFITLSHFGKRIESYIYNPILTTQNTVILTAIGISLFMFSLANIYGSNFNPFIYFRF